MKPKVIKTEAQYQATLARIETIFDAKPGTAKGDELELLFLEVESYEARAYAAHPFLVPKLRLGTHASETRFHVVG